MDIGPRTRRPRATVLPALVAFALLAGACARTGAIAPSSSPAPAGQTINVSGLPAPNNCDARLRAEIDAAVGIRLSLRIYGLSVGRDAAVAAAADPNSTLAEVGIPITPAERRALATNGLSVGDNLPLGEWVFDGAPERFGGIWVDPPGSGHYVVSIVGPDDASVELARCVAALTNLPTRFVVARMSDREGEALKDRISGDAQRIQSEGIPLTMVDYDETRGVVVVGIDKPTDAMVRRIHELYGPAVDVIDEQPAQAL